MKKNTALSQQILQDNIWLLMYRLSIPATIGMTVIGMNNVLDTFFIGHFLGETAVAGASLSMPLIQIVFALASMVAIGVSSIYSRAIGSKNSEIQKRIFGNMSAMSIVSGLFSFLLGFFFTEELVALMGGTAQAQTIGVEYFEVILWGAFFNTFGFSSNMLIRSEGNMKVAMQIAIISILVNMVLTPFFLVFLHMGVAGAAWATVIAWAYYSLANIWYYWKGKSENSIRVHFWELDKRIVKETLSVGFSAFLMSFMQFVQLGLMFRLISQSNSDADLAFLGVTMRIYVVAIMPIFGLVRSLPPIVGINYGAKDYDRVRKTMNIFILTGTILLALISLPLLISPEWVFGLMMKRALLPTEVYNFRILMLGIVLMPFVQLTPVFYQAIGIGKMASFITLLRQIVLFVPITIGLHYLMPQHGI